MFEQFDTPEPDEAVKLALRRIDEATARGEGSDVEGLAFNEVVVNMGPQHPATHGVLRVRRQRGEFIHQAGTGFHNKRAMLCQYFLIREYFRIAQPPLLEQEVLSAQGTAVS